MWWESSADCFIIATHQRINRKPHSVITVACDRNRKTQSCFFSAMCRGLKTVDWVLSVMEIETVETITKVEKRKLALCRISCAESAQTWTTPPWPHRTEMVSSCWLEGGNLQAPHHICLSPQPPILWKIAPLNTVNWWLEIQKCLQLKLKTLLQCFWQRSTKNYSDNTKLCLLIEITFEPAEANAVIRFFLPCFNPC